jgi:2-dehydro-3-deoxyphosphogluconate aldolase/(4S)-4-hydroxy-2-oxoglutarate aldolase
MLRFIPTGGISPANLDDYLALGAVAAVGGSWMATSKLVSGRRWAEISRLATEAVDGVARSRPAASPAPGSG